MDRRGNGIRFHIEKRGTQENREKIQGLACRGRWHILSDQYRVVVGGVGIVYDGASVSESKRQFRLFVAKSKTAGFIAAGNSVTLFKNYGIIKEYQPPDQQTTR
jgi:hypothetical protein